MGQQGWGQHNPGVVVRFCPEDKEQKKDINYEGVCVCRLCCVCAEIEVTHKFCVIKLRAVYYSTVCTPWNHRLPWQQADPSRCLQAIRWSFWHWWVSQEWRCFPHNIPAVDIEPLHAASPLNPPTLCENTREQLSAVRGVTGSFLHSSKALLMSPR